MHVIANNTYATPSAAIFGAIRAGFADFAIERKNKRYVYTVNENDMPLQLPVVQIEKPKTKKLQVLQLIRSGGASIVNIAHALTISKVAAASLIGDLKRDGYTLLSVKLENGGRHYIEMFNDSEVAADESEVA